MTAKSRAQTGNDSSSKEHSNHCFGPLKYELRCGLKRRVLAASRRWSVVEALNYDAPRAALAGNCTKVLVSDLSHRSRLALASGLPVHR
jgi:hypothetical protein